jgi:acyl-coenzyme A thioesterase PaaI-like protein
MSEGSAVLALYRKLARYPGGRWLFANSVCRRAPYFGSIAPRLTDLDIGRCEAWIEHRRRVQNHIGSVHAIALCNLAEFVAGIATEASTPASMRWIPRGMTVNYDRKAMGRQTAVASLRQAVEVTTEGYLLPVDVVIRDPGGEQVFSAEVRMWLSPRRSG